MTHADADRYAAKHPEGRMLNKKIAEAVRKRAANGEINCADASAIAENFRVDMLEVGVTIDLLEIRLKRCQLGLFGYGQKKVIVEPAAEVSAELEKAIRGNLADGRLPCLAAWGIADRAGIARMAVSSACEALKIKIKPCQLGAF
ncbi:MAG: hypothetical protein Q7I89_09800 [Syntrophales bacterium]|nr:hypothetical protein [Syntrophales bacterium]